MGIEPMVLRNSFFSRPQMLPAPAGSRAKPARSIAPRIRADKDHVLNYETREANNLKADIAALRASATPVDAATTRRYQRATSKRDLLTAEGNAYILGMVPAAVRKRAVRGIRRLKTGKAGAAALDLCANPQALLGGWDLIVPSAPASVGIRQMADLSLGGVDWGNPTVRVRAISRFFSPVGEFIETYSLRGPTDIIERFGTFKTLKDRSVVVDLEGVTLSHPGGVTTTIRVRPPRATLGVCYLDDDFCLIGNRRDSAERVQAWIKSDPLPFAW